MADPNTSNGGEESGSDERQSEVGGAREEYFSENTAVHVRRSERHQPYSRTPTPPIPPLPGVMPVCPDVPPDPPHAIVQKWFEEEGYVIMCWHVFRPGFSRLYMVNGTLREVDTPDILEHIVTDEHARSGRLKVLSVPVSIGRMLSTKLSHALTLNIIPTKKDWHGWLEPLSASAHIHFSCQECGDLCRLHNKYGWLIDRATRKQEAKCSLLGKLCKSGDMEMPRGIAPDVEERYYDHAPNCPTLVPHTNSNEEYEMHTAREPRGGAGARRSPRKRVALLKPRHYNTRYSSVTRPPRTIETELPEEERILSPLWNLRPNPLLNHHPNHREPHH